MNAINLLRVAPLLPLCKRGAQFLKGYSVALAAHVNVASEDPRNLLVVHYGKVDAGTLLRHWTADDFPLAKELQVASGLPQFLGSGLLQFKDELLLASHYAEKLGRVFGKSGGFLDCLYRYLVNRAHPEKWPSSAPEVLQEERLFLLQLSLAPEFRSLADEFTLALPTVDEVLEIAGDELMAFEYPGLPEVLSGPDGKGH